MVKRARRAAGFTLTELMIVVVILGVLVSMSAPLLIQVKKYFILTQARAALQEQARANMYVLTRELRQAQGATIVISQNAANQPYYSKITFTKQEGTTLSFYQNGNALVEQWGSHTVILSTDLQYLAFTFPRSDDMKILSVSMTLQTQIYQGQFKALHMASQQVQVMN
jgi:prepilin-type N-terminal cleavage/methylation domain-containing protein